MDYQLQKRLYNECNPDQPLDPGDRRNLNIDKSDVRGERWSDRIAGRIEKSNVPVCELFTGLRGTGKSTELRRLAERLADPKRMHLLTVLIDADEVLDITQEIDVSDLLSFILYNAEREVLAKEDKDPRVPPDGPFGRVWNWLSKTDVELQKVSAAPAGVGFELSFKHNPTLRQQVRKTVSAHLSTFVRQVREELIVLEERAKAVGYSGLVIIFDSLEKLRGASSTWLDVLASAERIFGGGAPHVQLPVHVLYTVPPALSRRMNDPISFLPMIKVRTQEGLTHKPGMDVIVNLVRLRIPAEALTELFGAGAEDDRIHQIGLWSGGYPREIVRVLQTILEEEEFPLSLGRVEKILERSGNTYRSIAYGSRALPWLGTVARSKKLICSSAADEEAADFLLSNNVIMRYLNDTEWVDVHPSIAGLPELAEPVPSSKPT